MALAANALVSVAELKAHLDPTTSATADLTAQLEPVIDRASDLIQRRFGRTLIVGGSDFTEYHTVRTKQTRIRLLDWPISSVTSVHEDAGRDYAAATLLTVDTDYIVAKPRGELIRVIDGGGAAYWQTGFRAIKVLYKAGYAITAVPPRIKDACLHLCALLWSDLKRGQWGVSSITDAAGNFSRLSVDHLPAAILRQLEDDLDQRWETTGERDA